MVFSSSQGGSIIVSISVQTLRLTPTANTLVPMSQDLCQACAFVVHRKEAVCGVEITRFATNSGSTHCTANQLFVAQQMHSLAMGMPGAGPSIVKNLGNLPWNSHKIPIFTLCCHTHVRTHGRLRCLPWLLVTVYSTAFPWH